MVNKKSNEEKINKIQAKLSNNIKLTRKEYEIILEDSISEDLSGLKSTKRVIMEELVNPFANVIYSLWRVIKMPYSVYKRIISLNNQKIKIIKNHKEYDKYLVDCKDRFVKVEKKVKQSGSKKSSKKSKK